MTGCKKKDIGGGHVLDTEPGDLEAQDIGNCKQQKIKEIGMPIHSFQKEQTLAFELYS